MSGMGIMSETWVLAECKSRGGGRCRSMLSVVAGEEVRHKSVEGFRSKASGRLWEMKRR